MRRHSIKLDELGCSKRVCLVLSLLALSTVVIDVANGEDLDRAQWRFSEFQWENDDIFPHPSQEPGDRFYTNGLRFTWTKVFDSNTERQLPSLPSWAQLTANTLCPDEDCYASAEAGFGQNFYTPEIIELASPQPDDRPWAGWLYGHLSVGISRSEKSLHRFELQVGLTGAASLSEQVQTEWHKLVDAPTPRGWDNQFDSELGANLFYDYQYRFHRENDDGFGFDILPNVTAAVGTTMTYAGAGFTARIGRHISGFAYRPVPAVALAAMDKVPKPLMPQQTNPEKGRPTWEYYFFLGGEGRGIAHNYFLEGSLFRNEAAAVSPERFVWDLRYGFGIRKGSWRITYAMIRRGPEFERSAGTDNGIHNYVSFSISRDF